MHDTAVSGPTGPVLGQRLRLEIQPAFGRLAFADVRVDARRYFMPVRPVTLAMRVEHVGRYGPDAGDQRLTPLVVGLQTLVRGYDLRTFMADECGRTATECSLLGELTGAGWRSMNLELRAPLLGLLAGDIDYGRVPIEAIAFVDAGLHVDAQCRQPARARSVPQRRRRRPRQHRWLPVRDDRRPPLRPRRRRLDCKPVAASWLVAGESLIYQSMIDDLSID